MITAVHRSTIFKSSAFADSFIATMQQRYAVDFNRIPGQDAAQLKKKFDHLEPFQPIDGTINQHAVLGFNAESKKEYIETFPQRVNCFFNHLGIQELYLLQFTNTNLVKDFPFQNFHNRNSFKRLAANNGNRRGYLLPVSALATVFPLFFFSGVYDLPVIFLLTATGSVPIAVQLCDDGNLHINFQERYSEDIRAAATEAGFEIGDLEICSLYSVHYLDKKKV